MPTSVLAVFNTAQQVETAVNSLMAAGQSRQRMSLLTREDTVPVAALAPQVNHEVTEGVAAGAVSGATLGLFAGLVIGAIAVPGVGTVLSGGALASLLGASAVGAGVGAVAGGTLLGGLAKLGVNQKEAELYAEAVRRGKILLVVEASDNQVERVKAITAQAGAEEINSLQAHWLEEGGQGFKTRNSP